MRRFDLLLRIETVASEFESVIIGLYLHVAHLLTFM